MSGVDIGFGLVMKGGPFSFVLIHPHTHTPSKGVSLAFPSSGHFHYTSPLRIVI